MDIAALGQPYDARLRVKPGFSAIVTLQTR
jgi:hypothetical protein